MKWSRLLNETPTTFNEKYDYKVYRLSLKAKKYARMQQMQFKVIKQVDHVVCTTLYSVSLQKNLKVFFHGTNNFYGRISVDGF